MRDGRKERKDRKDRKDKKDKKDKKERKERTERKERKERKDRKDRKDRKERKERRLTVFPSGPLPQGLMLACSAMGGSAVIGTLIGIALSEETVRRGATCQRTFALSSCCASADAAAGVTRE